MRSTLLLSSIQSLRNAHLGDRYAQNLAPSLHETLLMGAAGQWLPMSTGLAHYDACEALGLPLEEQVALGYQVGQRVQGSVLGLVTRTAKGAGSTPWLLLAHVGRLWERVFQGGAGASLIELGPKEARVELVGLPLLAVPYFRHAYRGAFLAALELLCSKGYVTEESRGLPPTATAYRLSWV